MIKSFSIERSVKYNHHYRKEEGKEEISSSKGRMNVVSASDLFDSDEEIAQKYDDSISKGPISKLGDELTVDVIRDTERLTRLANPKNWIVSEILKENYEVMKVELKPLDISPYCKNVFESLWMQTELYQQIKDANEQLKVHHRMQKELKRDGYVEGIDMKNKSVYSITTKASKLLKGWVGFLSAY